jgi:TonB family protein
MTLSERRYYQIAIGLSILLHAALFMITFPRMLGLGNGSGDQMETISAGLMDFGSDASDSGSSGPTVLANEAVEEVVTQPEPEQSVTVAHKEQPKPKVKAEIPKEVPQEKTVHESKIVHQEKMKQPKKAEQPKVEPKLQPKPENTKTVKSDNPVTDAKQAVKDKDGKPGGTGVGNGTGEGKGNGAGSGNGGKGGGGPRSLGSGENMVASGLEAKLYYPKKALNENKEGDVRLRALFTADGNLEKIELQQSSGDSYLDNVAFDYVKRLKFKPINEKYYVDMLVSFQIKNEAPLLKWLHAETRS